MGRGAKDAAAAPQTLSPKQEGAASASSKRGSAADQLPVDESSGNGADALPEWVQTAYGEAPGRVHGHTATAAAGVMVVVGGTEPRGARSPALTVGRFSLQPSPCWEAPAAVVCANPSPPPPPQGDEDDDTSAAPPASAAASAGPPLRAHALTQHCACANTAQDTVFIVGGWNPVACRRKHDVWCLSDGVLSSCTASGRFAGQEPGPMGVTFSACCCYKKFLYVFGGYTDSLTNTLWYVESEGGPWGVVTGSSSTPCPRSSHAVATVSSGFAVFGGRNAAGACLGDCYVYEADVGRWALLSNADAAAGPGGAYEGPSARYGHALAAYGQKLYVHGGVDADGTCLGDLYCMDLSSDAVQLWTEVRTMSAPTPRAYHSMVSLSGTLCAYGGRLRLGQERAGAAAPAATDGGRGSTPDESRKEWSEVEDGGHEGCDDLWMVYVAGQVCWRATPPLCVLSSFVRLFVGLFVDACVC